jgi:hypothetical protein
MDIHIDSLFLVLLEKNSSSIIALGFSLSAKGENTFGHQVLAILLSGFTTR